MYKPTIGKHSKHEASNDNWQRVTNFAIKRNMDLMKRNTQGKVDVPRRQAA